MSDKPNLIYSGFSIDKIKELDVCQLIKSCIFRRAFRYLHRDANHVRQSPPLVMMYSSSRYVESQNILPFQLCKPIMVQKYYWAEHNLNMKYVGPEYVTALGLLLRLNRRNEFVA